MTQSQALSILKTGANVFLTGEPGSGKTHTINEYTAYLRNRGIEPAITASTGIAATHIGGMTIHSWSGIGIKTKLDKHDLNKIASGRYIVKRVRRAKVLIIEEVSMLLPETLSMVDAVCREIKENPEPFGGMQIVFAGDFFQLPPVVKRETENNTQTAFIEESSARFAESRRARFAYDSPAWTEANPIICYLTEQHRQNDSNFLAILSAIRRNAFNSDHLHYIETRKIDPFDFAQVFDSEDFDGELSRTVAQTRGDQSRAIRPRAHRGAGRGIERRVVPDNAPKLFSHNADVDRINDEILAKLPGESYAFNMSSQGPDALVAALKKGCLSPETLSLKVGAAVMFTKNNPKEGFVNGTLGTVEGFNKTNGYPFVKVRNGQRIEVEPMDWTVEEDGKVRAQISQLPLRLAWAITVHKSQGMNLDEAVMDLSGVFEFGQGYVALSRVRRLSGLYILGWNERTFQVHPEILAKDEAFRLASSDAETTFSKISPAELQKRQANFISVCEGKPMLGRQASGEKKVGGGTSFEKIRETYPNAYRPWDKEQNERLRELFSKGLSVADLAKTFGRKRGAIRSRLVKLGLLQK